MTSDSSYDHVMRQGTPVVGGRQALRRDSEQSDGTTGSAEKVRAGSSAQWVLRSREDLGAGRERLYTDRKASETEAKKPEEKKKVGVLWG